MSRQGHISHERFSSHREDEAGGIGKSGLIFLIVALALILAIGFFYMTKDSVRNDPADQALETIEKADNAAINVGDAARNTMKRFRPQD